MPYPTEHAARIRSPDGYDRIRRDNGRLGEGIDAIFGIKGGKAEIQAIRFDASKFTAAEAKKWLKDHDFSPIAFEPATEKQEEHGEEEVTDTSFRRELAFEFGSLKDLAEQDGGLLVKGRKLLAAGMWTDSAVKTPLRYPPATLRQFAHNWADPSVWSRHRGMSPRDITDKVGVIINPRYENEAVVGDILLHGGTQKSRDAIELIRRNLINAVSVEHGGEEVFNPSTREYEASTLVFHGLALVNKGACKVCTIRDNEAKEALAEVREAEAPPEQEHEMTEIEDLKKALAEKDATIKTLEEGAAAADKAGKELEGRYAELDARMKKFENTPAPKSEAGKDEGRALEQTAEFHVPVNKTAKTVG